MVNGQQSISGPPPPDLSDLQIQIMPVPKFDRLPTNSSISFGDIIEGKDVKSNYKLGEIVEATFQGANPRNNFRTESSFLTVEKKVSTHVYATITNDGNKINVYHFLFFILSLKEIGRQSLDGKQVPTIH
jgi:neutral ceramidase